MITPLYAPSIQLGDVSPERGLFKSCSGLSHDVELVGPPPSATEPIVTDNRDPGENSLRYRVDCGLVVYNGHAGLGANT